MINRYSLASIATALAIFGLTAIIFIADTLTSLGVAVAVFYIAPILMTVSRFRERNVVALAILCIFLTFTSAVMTAKGAEPSALVNPAIAICAIATTAYLSLKMIAAEAAAHEARADLVRIARVTTLGALTASIAHEVNQPLAAIATSASACLRWLRHDPPQIDKASSSADRIVADAKRASDIVERLRGLARRSPPEHQIIDLNSLVHETIALAQNEIDSQGIAMMIRLSDEQLMIRADRVQIMQVIGNLLLNAIDAMAGVSRGKRLLTVTSEKGGDGMINFMISDTGTGLPAEAQDRAFDAFWTTKDGGIGVGLTISRDIVEAHSGRISASANGNAGAVFRINLPEFS